jgi:Protein of unknown function (DUF3239)
MLGVNPGSNPRPGPKSFKISSEEEIAMSAELGAEGDSTTHGSVHVLEDEHPYRGEELGGASATICPGFDPDPVRYLLYQPAMRIFLIFGLIVALLVAGCFAAGYALRISGGWWLGLLALLFYGLSSLLILIDLIVVTLLVMGYNEIARCFKNALLTAGVVVSEKPLAVVILASLSNGSGPRYYGLQRLSLSSLPYHSRTPGTRVPVVSSFESAEGLDRWLAFSPELICWGTGRRANIDQCFERLGAEAFERLDACVASGLIPKDDDELILLDEVDNKLATLSITEEQKKYQTQVS